MRSSAVLKYGSGGQLCIMGILVLWLLGSSEVSNVSVFL